MIDEFVAARRSRWERLEALLGRARGRRGHRLAAAELEESAPTPLRRVQSVRHRGREGRHRVVAEVPAGGLGLAVDQERGHPDLPSVSRTIHGGIGVPVLPIVRHGSPRDLRRHGMGMRRGRPRERSGVPSLPLPAKSLPNPRLGRKG